MQHRLDKAFYDLRAGLVTEAGPLNTPDGATVDEENFHLFIDGSRRRRRGLRQECGGQLVPHMGHNLRMASRVASWANAGSDPANDLIVVQIGRYLRFFKDEGTVVSKHAFDARIDMSQFATVTNVEIIDTFPVSMAAGNGILIVTGRYITPFYVEWEDGVPVPTKIPVAIRDFTGVVGEGLDVRVRPTELSEAHRYNLRNRGWQDWDIDQYFDDTGRYPSLNMLWHKGYAREVDTSATFTEGKRSWDSVRLSAEPFPNQSAPQGSLLINPFDTTEGFPEFGEEPLRITEWETVQAAGDEWVVVAKTSVDHGITVGQRFSITGQESRYTADGSGGEPGVPPFLYEAVYSFNGTQQAFIGTDGNNLTFRTPRPVNFVEWVDQFRSLGYVGRTGEPLENPEGYTTKERPPACAWYAGRVWMAGAAHPRLADRLMFSQLVTRNKEFGHFYQFNDPTNEALNQLLPTDGGVIQLSDVGTVQGLLPYQNVLLVFASNGVWEVAGANAVFTPDNFRLRKITDAECSSPWGFVEAEGRVMFLGTKGIFTIQPDEETGILYAVSVTEMSIQTDFSRISSPRLRAAKMSYDPVNKQVWVLHDRAPLIAEEEGGFATHRIILNIPSASIQGTTVSIETEPPPPSGDPPPEPPPGDPPPDEIFYMEVGDGKALLYSFDEETWHNQPWDSWTSTEIIFTPNSDILIEGAAWFKVVTSAGQESAPFWASLEEFDMILPMPPIGEDEDAGTYFKYAYRNALVYDIRLQAWHRMSYTSHLEYGRILEQFTTSDTSECGRFSNFKTVVATDTALLMCDMCRGNRTTFLYQDFDGVEVPAYLLMGPDSLENWQNKRHAPVVHVFSRRTELAANVNESSVLMSAQWDWTDNPNTGKWGRKQEVHRRNRPFVPENLDEFDDGYPLVVTRNKVRGSGRAMQLKFETNEGKDAHLLGYAIRYHASGRV